MRTKTPILMAVAVAFILGLVGGPAEGTSYYFDNVTGAGFGTAGGTWAAPTPGPNPGWTLDGTGAAVPGSVTTTTGDALNFGNGTNGLAGGTITISGTVDAGDMTFASGSGAITLSGGTNNLAPVATLTLNNASDTINSVLAGAATNLIKTGPGKLTLGGANSFPGPLSIENGSVFTTSINNKSVNGVLGAGTLIILGASGQTGRLSIQVDGGISSTKDVTLAAGGTGEIQFGNLGAFDITNADRPLTLSGNMGGSGNFVKLGGAAVVLSGSNTYSGTTTVSVGPLRLSHAYALPGGIGATGGVSALTINGTTSYGAVIELTAASGNFLRGLGTGVDQFQIPGGISGFDANGAARQVIVNNDASFELQWGTATFNPSTLLLGYHGVTATAALTLQNKIDLNGATRTIAVNASTATLSGDIQTSSGTAGITKIGAGTLVLSGTNTYSGPTTISAGALTIGNVSTFSNTSQIVLSGTSRLEVNAANASLAKLAAGGGVPFGAFLRYSQAQTAAGAANGPGTIRGTVEINLTNVNPDYTLDFGSLAVFQNLVAATYTSPLTLSGNASIDSSTAVFTLGSGGITASSSGAKTLTLTGSNAGTNTIGGAIGDGSGTMGVTKSGTGSWTLTGANPYSGATTVGAGTLTLAGANGAIGSSAVTIAGGTLTVTNANAANNGARLSDALAFTMSGGAFNFNNDSSANDFSESVGTLTLAGGANAVAIGQAASGRTSTLTFAGLSRTAGGVNFSGAGLGAAADPRSRITFTTPPPLTDGIIGPWATVNGNSYASLDGANNVVAYSGVMTDVTRKDSGTKVIPDSSTADVRIIEGTGALGTLTLAAATTTIRSLLQSVSGGTSAATIDIGNGTNLLVNSINQVATAGSLTLGVAGSAGTLKPATAGGSLLLINSSANGMTNNAVIADNASASSVTKDGAGVLRLSGNSTYSGGTVVNAGTLWVSTNGNLGAAGSGIAVNGSAAVSLGNNYQFAFPPAETVNLGSRLIAVNNGAMAGVYYNTANVTITVPGAITGNGGITYGRDPVLTFGGGSGGVYANLLSTGNTFTGPFTLGVNASENVGVASDVTVNSLADSPSPITFNLGGGWTFSYGAGAVANLSVPNRPIDLRNSNVTIRNLNATYTMTLGPVFTTTAGAKSLNLGAGGAGGAVAGAITDGVGQIAINKTSGPWSFSGTNTYTGITTLGSDSGQLTILGRPALSPYSSLLMGRGNTLSLRMDDAGTVSLGNLIQLSAVDTSSGVTSSYTIEVRNNGGATTGSTLALGKVDFAGNSGNNASSRRILSYGANGYRLQFGDVDLHHAIVGVAAGGPQRFEPQTAPITITGTIRQIVGNTGASTTDNNLYIGGVANGNLVSGTITDAADYPANPNATSLNVTKGETSDWTLSGTNTYTGTTTVNGGLLRVTGALNGSGAVSVTAGLLGGTGSINGAVTLSGTGGIDVRDGVVGTLTLNNGLALTGAAGANNLGFDLGRGASVPDKIAVTGNVTMAAPGAAVITLNQLTGTRIDAGTYDLIDATGAVPAATNFTLVTTAANGNTFTLQSTASKLQLVVTAAAAAPPVAYWTGSSDTNWSTAGNWVDAGGASISGAPGYNTDVSFHYSGATRLTTGILDRNFDINSLTYVAGATNSTTIGGANRTLTIEAGNGITVSTPGTGTPTHTISCKIGMATNQTWTVNNGGSLTVGGSIGDFGGGYSVTKAGAGTLTLSGLNTYRGATIVNTGTLTIWHLSLGNAAVANVLGMASVDPSNLLLGPGTMLSFVVSDDTATATDRGFTINGTAPGDSATIDSSGAGYRGVQFTSTACPGYGTPNQARTLILAGTQASGGGNYNNNNRIYANIADNGTGAVSLLKQGAGSWQLWGNSTYTGGTTVNGGALRMGVVNALPTAGAVTLTNASGASLVFDNSSQTIGSLSGGGSGGGSVDLGSGSLTVGDANSTTYAGVISGTGGLVKRGAGTLTLSGINTYAGSTTIANGALGVVAGGSCSNSAVTVSGAASLQVSVTNNTRTWTCSSLTLTNGARVTFSFAVTPNPTVAPLNVKGSVTFGGTPVVVVDPANVLSSQAYPLLVAGGTAPVTLPTLEGVKGVLSWGGAGNKTLYVTVDARGTLLMVE